MPQNKKQDFIFTIMMVTAMVYGMVVYNIAFAQGGLEYHTFAEALKELPIMIPIAFALEHFVVGKIAKKMAFSMVTPDPEKPYRITFAISCSTICLMVPCMSMIATLLFHGFSGNILMLWGMAMSKNVFMALFWQLLVAGPLVRWIFRHGLSAWQHRAVSQA